MNKEHEKNIHESLDNARDNGFDPLEKTIHENVMDLELMDSYCENLTYDEIKPHVISYFWKNLKRRV